MKKTNSNSFGKISAVALILLFVGINYFKPEKDIIPKNSLTTKKQSREFQIQNGRNKVVEKTHNVEKLKYAYTGKWEKNDVSAAAVNGEYSFTTPTNTRSMIKPSAKKDDKKKKVAAKKKKTDKKIAKKTYKKNSFGNHFGSDEYDADNTNYNNTYVNPYYAQQVQQQQQRTPSDDEKEKQLTLPEWLAQITQANSISDLVTQYLGGKVSQNLFYQVIDALIASTDDNTKKLGFDALAQTPSGNSFTKTVTHMNDEMSSELKAYAQSSLTVYEKPNQLRILNAALSSKNTEVQIVAANIIRSVTTSILQAQTNSGENAVYKEADMKAYKAMLTQSLNVINNALELGLNDTVASSFHSAQSVLAQFLS